MDKDLSNDYREIATAIEAYKRNEEGSANSLIQKLEAMKMRVEGPPTFLARMRYQPLLNMCVVIAMETGMLKTVVAKDGAPVSAHDVALETGQDELLIMRVLRQLYVNGVCEELGPGTFGANDITRLLDTREQRAACKYVHDLGFKIGANLTHQIHTTGIQMFSDKPGNTTPFQAANGRQQFDYLSHNPEHKQLFDDYMVMRKADIQSSWDHLYPVENLLRDESNEASSDRPVVVDIGGGVGTDLMSLHNRFPGAAGRLVLEDLPYSLDRVRDLPHNVEKVEFNFFTMEQPVKGARVYFMHEIIHDWSDEQATKILKGTARAMKNDYSVLLIQDMVLPDTGATLRGSTQDVLMMMFPAGIERTKTQWQKLLIAAGLELRKVWTDEKAAEPVLEATLKK